VCPRRREDGPQADHNHAHGQTQAPADGFLDRLGQIQGGDDEAAEQTEPDQPPQSVQELVVRLL
jgi:hypothetical protein